MNNTIGKYLLATGLKREDIINKSRKADVVRVRTALMYLAWENEKHKVSRKNTKSKVYEAIGRDFGMKRVNVHERLAAFESGLVVYKGDRELLDRLREIICL